MNVQFASTVQKKAFELLFEITNSTPDKFNLVYNSEEDNYVEYNNIPF